MPTGSFDIGTAPQSLYGPAPQAVVSLYDADSGTIAPLPNVRCVRIDVREGPEPPVATFRYIQDDTLAISYGWPSQFEQLWPLNSQGYYTVQCDDELIVSVTNPDDSLWIPFDGFASIPQVDYTARSQSVTFAAQNVAIRYFDEPITQRTQRNADNIDVTDGSEDVTITMPTRFNPADNSVGRTGGYVGNKVGDSYFTTGNPLGDYPVFVDPLVVERADEGVDYWYVDDAVEYLMATYEGEDYATWPSFNTLEKLLNAQYPASGSQTFNPAGDQSANISIRDYDATNKAMPIVFADLMGYAGFLLYWDTDADSDGAPETTLKLYRRDAASTVAPKPLFLAATGASSLNLNLNNTTACHLVRDTNQIKNAWQIETQQKQIEITVLLAPLFEPVAGDQNSPARDAFQEANLTNATGTTRRKYRWFGADECADGHWDSVDQVWVTDKAIDLTPIFPADEDGNATYVKRYRPGGDTLIAQDPQGRPLKAVLEYRSGVTVSDPYVCGPQDPASAGTWLTISSGWRLLPDRLGIEITAPDPSMWSTGNSKIPKINVIDATANQTDATQFCLRLTTVIDDDSQLDVVAPRRIASPTQYSRTRIADGKDHFQFQSISVNSLNYTGDGTNPQVMRDDTDLAQAHVYALRGAHEFPTLAGSVTIPWLTDYYEIGDRISLIQGRNASFLINVGSDQGEAPSYPWVVGVSWVFEPQQQTILQLSDSRAEPQPYRG